MVETAEQLREGFAAVVQELAERLAGHVLSVTADTALVALPDSLLVVDGPGTSPRWREQASRLLDAAQVVERTRGGYCPVSLAGVMASSEALAAVSCSR